MSPSMIFCINLQVKISNLSREEAIKHRNTLHVSSCLLFNRELSMVYAVHNYFRDDWYRTRTSVKLTSQTLHMAKSL